jgi:multidrug efflux system membrane fusion protein
MKFLSAVMKAITSDGLQQGDIVVVGGVNKLAEDQNVRLEAGVSQ